MDREEKKSVVRDLFSTADEEDVARLGHGARDLAVHPTLHGEDSTRWQ